MKSIKIISLFLFVAFCYSSCVKDRCEHKARMFFPIYKTRDAVLKDVKMQQPKAITNGGKIFSYGSLLFVNEVDKGIHVINNADPANPIKTGFLNVEGNLDLWVRNNLLYADCYDNLLVIDISDINNVKLVESLPNVFPDRVFNGNTIDESKGYVIGWMERDTTIKVECSDDFNISMLAKNTGAVYAMDMSSSGGGNSFIPTSGVAGSLTRFNVTGNFLYCVDNMTIHSFNITAQKPVKSSDVAIGWGVETIYSFNSNLFIGTNTGVLIYSIASPDKPTYVNKMQHVRTCDPVITDGQTAYLTLRGGSPCGGFTNQLDVLNVKDVLNVTLLKSYPLTSPYGLGMDDKYLFVCDDNYGIRVFNRADAMQMTEIKKITIDHPRDIIVLNNSLLVLAEGKILQFDYTDLNNIHQVSQIN